MKPQSLKHVTLCAALLAPAALSHAQSGNPTPTADEEIVLSPFTVSTTKDLGYLAGNTLAGSRLNTALKDTGAAISVLTPEFIKDIGATNMKDLILFQNNAVPDFGDSANSVNGNPMIGNDEWQLRIRGLAASYARNYFKWETSSDFYNVDRIDQSRGPNSILFGFGAPGGIVNTTTKQAILNKSLNEVSLLTGSWNRLRGSFDTNQVISSGVLALRVNGVAESSRTWREFESERARRGHVALKYAPTKTSTLRFEAEVGKVNDNVARPWLAIDECYLWRDAKRPTYSGTWPSGGTIATFWPAHIVRADDGVVRTWYGEAYASNANGASAATGWNAPTWSQLDEKYYNIVPRNSNLAGPDAARETKYNTESVFYENQITDRLSMELAVNHQESKFKGYDADGSRATNYYGNSSEIWGDASATLPNGAANPNAGKLYIENNWTRRTQDIKSSELRATAAYKFDTGSWGKHQAAGLLDYSERHYKRVEECEAFLNMPNDTTAAEADVNRLYRRHYFTEGKSSDIHAASWREQVAGAGWVTDQPPEDTKAKQWTGMVALQSFFLKNKLVTTLGLREDSLRYRYDIGADAKGTRDSVTKQWRLDPATARNSTFDATTLTTGAVYHVAKYLSVYGNYASSRDIPDVRIHLVNSPIPPMAESKGGDAGVKLDLFDGKLFITAGYYKTKTEHATDWGNVQTAITDRNTKILSALQSAGLVTAAEKSARMVNANGYMQDRDSSGWEFQAIANPTTNWRVSANFSINRVIARNSMAEVKSWAAENSAWWLAKAAPQGGADFLLGGGSWDTLGANIGWMNGDINPVINLDGKQSRGQRQYGGNLYTRYTFDSGFLKNVYVGGGGRYQSANVLGFYNGDVRYGRSLVLADASLGYTFKTDGAFGKGSWVETQVNVSNVLNNRRSQIYTLAWWDPTSTVPERIGLQEPRRINVEVTLHF